MADTPLAPVVRHIHKLAGLSPLSNVSDAQLLERFVQRHDEDAFAALVLRHGPLVWRVCRRVLRQRQHAEEAYQAVFLVLVRRAAKVRKPAALASFLYGVAYRIARQARADLRRQSRQREPIAAPVADPADEVAWRELGRIVVEEVHALPEKYRSPILLCYWEGLTNEEAAVRLGWPAGTVKTRLFKARQRLHERLTRRGVSLSAGTVVTLLAAGSGDAAVPPIVAATTARLALDGTAGASAGVTALADQAIQSAALSKVKIVLVLLLGSAITASVGALAYHESPARPPQEQPKAKSREAEQSKAQAEQPKIRTDRYDDPLPPGALARLGTVRFRHAGWIQRLAFSSDGTRLAYAGSDGIRLWETDSGRPVRHFGERADALAFLDGGRRILAGGENLIAWDIASGKEIKRLPIKGGLHRFQLSPDGKLLAGIGSGGALLLLDAATGKVLKQLDGHEDQISKRPKGAPPPIVQIGSIAFSPNGKALASVCHQDKRVFIWDTATGKVRHTLPGHDRPQAVQFSSDGRLLAVGGEDCLIRLWDVATGRKLQQLRGHVGAIGGLAFSPDGLKLASGASTESSRTATEDYPRGDGTIRLWDLKTGKCQPLLGPERWVQAIAFSPDGKLLAAAAGGWGKSICLIDVATGKRRQRRIGHEGRIFCIALSPDGSTLASGGEDNRLHLWDLKTSQEKARLEGHRHHVSGLAFTPDGGELLSCSYDGTVRAWDWRRGEETRRFAETNGWHYGFDLAPDGKTLILPTGQLRNIATGKQSGTVPNIEGIQNRFVFSPDSKRVALPRGEAAVVLDVKTGKEICRLTGHEPRKDDPGNPFNNIQVDCVAFGPDGRRVVSGGAEGLAFVWDAATGKMLRRLQGHENPIIGIAFSPDGRMVATASGDWRNHKEQTVRLWEMTTGKERRRFVGHQAQVTSIVFSHDGTTIISGSEDGTALVWDTAGVLKPEMARGADGESLWRTLASEDAVAAFEAVCALAARTNVAFLSKRLKRVEVADAAKIGRYLADLDSNEFATRERAERELGQLEELAEPEMRKVLAESVSLEVSRRVERLLAKLDASPPSAQTLQALRAIEVLERIATPEARQLLRKLADGAPEARLTREAKASLQRLARRENPTPRR